MTPTHFAIRVSNIATVQVYQIAAEFRGHLRREGTVDAVGGPVLFDERIDDLFGSVSVFRTIVPFEQVVLKRRTQQRLYFHLVAPPEGTWPPGWWREVDICNLEHAPDSAVARPCLNGDASASSCHSCEFLSHFLLIRGEH